jgi:hypothetical protein
MFSAWDFHGWLISVGVLLFMLSVFTGFGAFVSALMSWIWREEPEVAAPPQMKNAAKEPPFRKAA